MARSASLMRRETRRRRIISCGLAAAAIAASLLATNERALFVPADARPLSATVGAFSAMFTPSELLPRDIRFKTASPISPFDVTADTQDMRRRLTDAFGEFVAPADGDRENMSQFGSPALSPVELVSAGAPNADASVSTGPIEPVVPIQDAADDQPSTAIPPLNPQLLLGISPGDLVNAPASPLPTPVPEPSVWIMMLAGFSAVGYMLRRRGALAQPPIRALVFD